MDFNLIMAIVMFIVLLIVALSLFVLSDRLDQDFGRRFFAFNTRQLVFAILMGSLAFSVRNFGLSVIIYPPFRIDPRWIFSLLGACWTGPFGGLICGALAAMKLPYPMLDLAAIPVHFVIGLAGKWLINNKRSTLYTCVLWPILGVPSYWLTTVLVYSWGVAITYIPILLFIGVTGAILAFVVGLAVEKRARFLLTWLQV